jgi:hypothetical protein
MAHECPECGMMCYCDMEDTMLPLTPADCGHECDEEFDDDDDYEPEQPPSAESPEEIEARILFGEV